MSNQKNLENEIDVFTKETLANKVKRKKKALDLIIKVTGIFIVIGGFFSVFIYFALLGDIHKKEKYQVNNEANKENTENNKKPVKKEEKEKNINQELEENKNKEIKVVNKFKDPNYQFVIGLRQIKGEGVPQNIEEGLKWLKMAANENNIQAQLEIGKLYLTGSYLPTDYIQAINYLTMAAKNNNADAQYLLANIYRDGLGVNKDEKYAKQLYQQAILQGHELARKEVEKYKNISNETKKIKVNNNEVEEYLKSIKNPKFENKGKEPVEIILN